MTDLHGIPGHVGVLGNHDGDGLPHIADLVPGQHRVFGGPECIGVDIAPGWDVRRYVFQVRGGHHGHHAGGLTGGRHLQRGEDGMGMGTAQHHGMQQTR